MTTAHTPYLPRPHDGRAQCSTHPTLLDGPKARQERWRSGERGSTHWTRQHADDPRVLIAKSFFAHIRRGRQKTIIRKNSGLGALRTPTSELARRCCLLLAVGTRLKIPVVPPVTRHQWC